MSPKKVQDGGGDALFADEVDEPIKAKDVIRNTAEYQIDPYEGPPHRPTDVKEEVRREEPKCSCPRSDGDTKEQKPHQSPAKKVTSRHEDPGRLEVPQAKETTPVKNTPPILTDCFFDEETESSPIVEDRSNEIRVQRQHQYRQELAQQISLREETRAQRKAKRGLRAAQRRPAPAPAPVAPPGRSAVDRFEHQLRMEQMEEMRRQLARQREREVQRLRRIYRYDDRKLAAHLDRLKLREGDGDAPSKMAEPELPAPTDKKLDLKPASTEAKPENPADVQEKVSSARVPSKKPEAGDHRQPSSTIQRVEKPSKQPLSLKQAYLRLQEERRAEDKMADERRAAADAWRADLARQQRLQRDVRNMADWRTSRSLAGVPLVPIAPSQRARFEAAASWLQRTRGKDQEKRIERDRQLASWREEKDRQVKERRMKEKAEEKIAREMQNERRKEAEKCFQRWILEIRARKAAERASIPRGAIGVSTYASAYSVPLAWRQLPKQTRREKHCRPASLDGKRSGNVTHKVLS